MTDTHTEQMRDEIIIEPKTLAAFLATPTAQEIIGMPCFAFIKEAEIFRMTGEPIGRRAEEEQAFFLTHLLQLAAAHGARWRNVFAGELEERIAKIRAAHSGNARALDALPRTSKGETP